MKYYKPYDQEFSKPGECSFKDGDNKYITETAGFVPLEVKLRRFQETGQMMAFNTQEFTSSDLRELYLSPDLEITPEMDLEEIEAVQFKRQEFVNKLIQKKAAKAASGAKAPETPASAGEKTDSESGQKNGSDE